MAPSLLVKFHSSKLQAVPWCGRHRATPESPPGLLASLGKASLYIFGGVLRIASWIFGTRVFFEGPYGTFVAGKASRGHVVLVGGGVGITPIRAIMEELRGGV